MEQHILLPPLVFTKYYARNNPFSNPQNACFKETTVVAYRRSPNLCDLSVRVKLNNPANTTQPNQPGTSHCNSKHGYLTCPHIEDGRTSYTFSNTGEMWEIKQQMTCKSKNLTYIIECKRCRKQYVGEPKPGLEIATSTDANATSFFSLATKIA